MSLKIRFTLHTLFVFVLVDDKVRPEHELLILGEESLAVNPRRPVLTDLGCLRPPHGVPIKELHVPLKRGLVWTSSDLKPERGLGKIARDM